MKPTTQRVIQLAILAMTAVACQTTSTSQSSGCGPFSNCTELNRVHPSGVPSSHCAYRAQLDRDRDGWACER